MATLENYLKENFSGVKTLEKKNDRFFSLSEAILGSYATVCTSIDITKFGIFIETFDIFTGVSIEEINSLVSQFYVDAGYILCGHKDLSISHILSNLSFEKGDEKVFIIISSFDSYFKVSVVTFR